MNIARRALKKNKGDIGEKATSTEYKRLLARIKHIYKKASSDMDDKLKDFVEKHEKKVIAKLEELKAEKITKEEYQSWMKGQVFQLKQWETKRNQLAETMMNADKTAMAMVNNSAFAVFAENANWQAYMLEAGAGVNMNFAVYNADAVAKMVKKKPQVLPKWKIKEKKTYVWNAKKVNAAVTQGILQGKPLKAITNDLTVMLSARNKNLMKTFARTAMTCAQNAGREETLLRAKHKGIGVKKQWVATFDNHTRDTHAEIDGETKEPGEETRFSNGCRYPGDPTGDPSEVYNCRCAIVGVLIDYPPVYDRYDNIGGKPVKAMTYAEWKEAK